MTFKELNNMAYEVSKAVRAVRTFSMILNAAVVNIHSIDCRNNELPELDDITAVAFMLADGAEAAVDCLINNLPADIKGITP